MYVHTISVLLAAALLHLATPRSTQERLLEQRPNLPLGSNSAASSPYGSRLSQNPLAYLLRKRSMEARLQAPPSSAFYPETMLQPLTNTKRGGDEMWIWMPAHGYVRVLSQGENAREEDSYRVGNLMRHG